MGKNQKICYNGIRLRINVQADLGKGSCGMEKKPWEKDNWFGDRRAVRLMVLAALLVLGIIYFPNICRYLGFLWQVCQPLVLGAAMAYVLEIIVKYLEAWYFPNSKKPLVVKSRRIVCILLAAVIVVSVITLVIRMVIPGLTDAVTLLARELPVYAERARLWVVAHTEEDLPAVADALREVQFDWVTVQQKVMEYMMSGLGGILTSTVSIIGTVAGGVASFFMSLIFAVFLLMGKRKLHSQSQRLMAVTVKHRYIQEINHVFHVAHRCFSGFIVGQTLDSMLLGALTALGMTILGMPYPVMIGVLNGTMGMIPIVGGYIGGIVGAFLVFTVSPVTAIWYLVFIIILQQISGNLIYPRLVGSSIGLPGLWVIIAVTVGGGLGGVGGMLVGVPLMATVYRLVREWVAEREKAQPVI